MRSSAPRVERFLVPLLFRTQLYRTARQLNRRKAVIVMYHGFTARDSHEGIENHEQKHLHHRAFVEQLEFLRSHYTVVPLDEIVHACTAGTPLPDRAAAITIDDGYRSTYSVSYPALKRLQLPASVFLATDFVDNRRFLWTDRIEYAINHASLETLEVEIAGERLRLDMRDMASRMAADRRLRSTIKQLRQETRDRAVEAVERAAGCSLADAAGDEAEIYRPLEWAEASEMIASGLISIGSHTHTHVILSRCEPAHAAEELRQSKQIIENRLGLPCRSFCYPNGRRGDFNATTRQLLKEQGYSSALTTVYGINGSGADVYELTRYNLGKPMMPGEVAVRLSGIFEAGAALRRAVTQRRDFVR